MKEKLLELMQREGLNASRLAEMLDANPAAISHILAGRNKPGFDLLQKILRRFPRIDPDWLLLDAKEMYRNGRTTISDATAQRDDCSNGDLFSVAPRQTGNNDRNSSINSSGGEPRVLNDNDTRTSVSRNIAGKSSATMPDISAFIPNDVPTQRSERANITRIVIFYDDATFDNFESGK